jgi:hypothetical protein
MAVCDCCGLAMGTAYSCLPDKDAIPYGAEQRFGVEPPLRCHDCGVMRAGVHHPGCDVEECRDCGGQLISCAHAEAA